MLISISVFSPATTLTNAGTPVMDNVAPVERYTRGIISANATQIARGVDVTPRICGRTIAPLRTVNGPLAVGVATVDGAAEQSPALIETISPFLTTPPADSSANIVNCVAVPATAVNVGLRVAIGGATTTYVDGKFANKASEAPPVDARA